MVNFHSNCQLILDKKGDSQSFSCPVGFEKLLEGRSSITPAAAAVPWGRRRDFPPVSLPDLLDLKATIVTKIRLFIHKGTEQHTRALP